MTNQNSIEYIPEISKNKLDDLSNDNKISQRISKNSKSNNYRIPISINKKIKSAFKIALENDGIDIMYPNDFIERVYTYLSEDNKSEQMEGCRCRIEIFVKTFIFFLVNWKFPLLEKTFDIKENFLKILLKKQLFKCSYLKHNTIGSYKKNDNLQVKNYFIIFNVIKSIEYKYGNYHLDLSVHQRFRARNHGNHKCFA